MAAHQILRKNSRLFISLFSMMLISGMPELQTDQDILYLVDTLSMNSDSGSSDKNFQTLISSTGGQMSTRMNFFVHNLVH